jgi:nitrite reductase/ring-hydroxylating ferredoxin subunit
VKRLGGRIATDCQVVHVETGEPCSVELADGSRATARHLVIATNVPFHDRFAIHTKQAAYRSYIVGVGVPSTLLGRALFWDTQDPYHYLRWVGSDLLLVGGEDHRVGQDAQPMKRWLKLEEWVRSRIPSVGEVRTCWSGQILEPADGLAFIGRNPGLHRGSYVVTGDSGNGMTHGALAGILISDLILGRKNEWEQLYDPARKPTSLAAIGEYLRENGKVAKSYADWLKPAQSEDTQVAPGTGEVLQRGLHKLAVYVDKAGVRHECSAVCPHLGAVVQWNAAERSWDCPAHGSRFDPCGKLLMGPAQRGLRAHGEPAPTGEAAAEEE